MVFFFRVTQAIRKIILSDKLENVGTSRVSRIATGSSMFRLMERFCLTQRIWMPLSSRCTNLSSQITERGKISTAGCHVWRFVALGPYFRPSFIVLFSLKLWSWMQTQQTQNSFPGRKSYQDFRETGPRSSSRKVSLSIVLTFSFIVFANAKFLLARSIIGYFQVSWHLTINC